MTRLARTGLVACAIASVTVTSPVHARQSRAPGTARLTGSVVTADDPPAPVRRAIVRLTGEGNTNLSAVTGNDGRFEIAGVRAGRVTILVSKPAYLTTAYGATQPGRPGTSVAVADGQRIENLRIVLPRGAVIAGTVRDPSGEPATSLRVSIVPAIQRPPRPDARPTDGPEHQTRTDERGQFRAYGLPPGDYLVRTHGPAQAGPGPMASFTRAEIDAELRRLQARAPGATAPAPAAMQPAPTRHVNFVPTFHPGTADASSATVVRVVAGQVTEGIDIALALVPVSAVAGVVRRGDGAAISASLFVIPVGAHAPLEAFVATSASSRAGSDATFRVGNLAPGQYLVQARTGNPVLWASVPVRVSGADVDRLVLDLRPAPTLDGRVQFDATRLPPPSNLGLVRLTFTEAATESLPLGVFLGAARTAARVTVDARRDGTFQTKGLLPGPFLISATAPGGMGASGWWLRSIVAGGRDLLDHPFVMGETDLTGVVVTFSDRHTAIGGTLETTAGAPEPFIVALPADRALWWPGSRRLQSTRPGTDGRYSFVDLPPGEYLLAALTDLDEDTWRTREVLEQLAPAGVRVTLGEGEKKVQDLRVR